MDNFEDVYREKLLIINDDAHTRQLMVDYLSKAGYHVDCSQVCELSTLQESNPDLILLDLGTHENNRLDFIAEIFAHDPDVPIVVLTHVGIEDLTVEALRMNVTDYLLMLEPLALEMVKFSIISNLNRAALAKENRKNRKKLETTNIELQERLKEIQLDQQAGRLVQEKMLPQNPYKLLDCQFEHLILPANYLSGDFVDYHQISEDKLVFFLLDVTGHGASSAFVTVLIKQLAIRSRKHFVQDQHHEVHSAAWILNWINRSLLDIDIDRHLTIFLGVIDKKNNTLNYSYGGHFPKAIFSTGKEVVYLEGQGLPVGLFEHAEYENHYLDLPKEYGITLFSDGVLEVMTQETLAKKEEYLLNTVREENNIGHIAEQLRLGEHEHAPDDISVLTVNSCRSNEFR